MSIVIKGVVCETDDDDGPDLDMECPACGAEPGVECDHWSTYEKGGPADCVECGEPNEILSHDRSCNIGLEQYNAMLDLQIGE